MRVHANVYACFYHLREGKEEDLEGEEEVSISTLLVCAQTTTRRKFYASRANSKTTERVPKIVPEHVVPFFNSIVTVSLFNFWRNLTSFIVRVYYYYCTPHVVFVRAFNFL